MDRDFKESAGAERRPPIGEPSLVDEPRDRQEQGPLLNQPASSTCKNEPRSKSISDTRHSRCSCCCPGALRNAMPASLSFASACFLAELLGTFLLVLIGDSTIATFVVTRRAPDTLTTCLGFGVGAMIACFSTARISGAHLNPCASLAQALDGKMKWSLLPVYMLAQYLGGFLAAAVLFINNTEAINALDGGLHTAFGSTNSTGHIFATFPGAWVSPWGSLLDQIIGTAVLLFALSAIADKRNLGLEDKYQPFGVALIICIVCVAFSPNCGAIFNPARDLAPRLFTSLVGYPDVWKPVQGLYWVLAGLVGPHIGALLGYFAYKFLVGAALDCVANYHLEQLQLASEAQVNKQRTLDAPFKQHHQYYLRQQQQQHEPLSHQAAATAYGPSEPTGQRPHHVHKMPQ